MGQRFWQKGVSGRLLGLLPIRSTDESTEKSEDGELLTNYVVFIYFPELGSHVLLEDSPLILPSICLYLCGRIN